MATQHEALRLMLEAISTMRAAGYTQQDVQALTAEAWEHLEGGAEGPLCLRPLHQLPPGHSRMVSLPVVHPGPRALPEVRQAVVISAPRFLTSRHSAQ